MKTLVFLIVLGPGFALAGTPTKSATAPLFPWRYVKSKKTGKRAMLRYAVVNGKLRVVESVVRRADRRIIGRATEFREVLGHPVKDVFHIRQAPGMPSRGTRQMFGEGFAGRYGEVPTRIEYGTPSLLRTLLANVRDGLLKRRGGEVKVPQELVKARRPLSMLPLKSPQATGDAGRRSRHGAPR